jgi:hypothetical protein
VARAVPCALLVVLVVLYGRAVELGTTSVVVWLAVQPNVVLCYVMLLVVVWLSQARTMLLHRWSMSVLVCVTCLAACQCLYHWCV